MLVGNADELKALSSQDIQEDVLADRAKAMTVYRAGSTATLYIDLGTGQMAFKLLALGADGSLIYEDLLTCPFNLVDRPARQSSRARRSRGEHPPGYNYGQGAHRRYPRKWRFLRGPICGRSVRRDAVVPRLQRT